MALPASLSRALAWSAVPLVGVVTVGLVGAPAARADTFSVSVVLAAGQSGPIGTLVSNTDVTPVSSCDPGLSVSFDATMAGTVTVAPAAPLGGYACSVDFQLSGQSTGLVEQVSVSVVPGLSVTDVTVQEGNVGLEPLATPSGGDSIPQTSLVLRVAMSEPSSSAVTVVVSTADGTATAEGTATEPADYTPVSTTLTFLPGVVGQFVAVPVAHDNAVEPDETFFVNLSVPTGAAIVDGQGIGTILNDDQGPIVR